MYLLFWKTHSFYKKIPAYWQIFFIWVNAFSYKKIHIHLAYILKGIIIDHSGEKQLI